MSYEEPKSRMSFGNILLSLLLLGTITVIGLIVLVYFKLTNPSERTTVTPVQASAPARPVEKLVPNGTNMVSASDANPNPASVRQPPLLIPYSQQNAQAKDAEDAVNTLNNSNTKYNSRALTDGAVVPKKTTPRRRTNTQTENAENTTTPATRNNTRSSRNNQAIAGEVPLQPTNAPRERTLTPRNTPSASQNNTNNERPRRTYTAPPRNEQQGERVLTPTRPARKSNDAIDELF